MKRTARKIALAASAAALAAVAALSLMGCDGNTYEKAQEAWQTYAQEKGLDPNVEITEKASGSEKLYTCSITREDKRKWWGTVVETYNYNPKNSGWICYDDKVVLSDEAYGTYSSLGGTYGSNKDRVKLTVGKGSQFTATAQYANSSTVGADADACALELDVHFVGKWNGGVVISKDLDEFEVDEDGVYTGYFQTVMKDEKLRAAIPHGIAVKVKFGEEAGTMTWIPYDGESGKTHGLEVSYPFLGKTVTVQAGRDKETYDDGVPILMELTMKKA